LLRLLLLLLWLLLLWLLSARHERLMAPTQRLRFNSQRCRGSS
jgi:hypothetical protein